MRAVIHIGAEKTGTTALQAWFTQNVEALAAGGVHYPQSISRDQHWPLALYAVGEDRTTLLGELDRAYSADRATWRARLVDRLSRELDALPSAGTLLFSSEHLSSQLVSEAEVQRLRTLLDRWCDDYTVVLYLRRQDRARVSLYSTELRAGSDNPDVLGPAAFSTIGLDYERILHLWSSVFGRTAIVPRVYDRLDATKGALLPDFCAAAGLSPDAFTSRDDPRANPPLSSVAQQLVRGFNELIGADPTFQPVRRAVAQEAARTLPGPPRRPSRAEARRFLAGFARANDRVADQWFGGEELFDDQFDEYPEVADPVPSLDSTEVLAIMVRVVRGLLTQ